MKIERTDEGIIYFYVDEEYLKRYGLGLDTFRDKKPFKTDIFDTLLDKTVKEKSNVVYMENEFIENENITKGIWELFRTLPDEKMNMGIIDVDKKRELLEQIRSDKGIDYIRTFLIVRKGFCKKDITIIHISYLTESVRKSGNNDAIRRYMYKVHAP